MGCSGSRQSGIFFNQSDMVVVYTLHYSSLTDTEQVFEKAAGFNAKVNMTGPQVGLNGNIKITEKQEREKIDSVYQVNPGRVTIVGLEDVDFDKVKFMTMVSYDPKEPTVKGKVIVTSANISKNADIRLKIRPDLSLKPINDHESKILFQISQGERLDTSNCIICKENGKSGLTGFQGKKLCKSCLKQSKDIWVCYMYPNKHFYCQACFKSNLNNKVTNLIGNMKFDPDNDQ